MINTKPYKLILVSRNEGKLKSYESCADLRAWSHDVETKSQHLKAWIQIDMPFCIIPVSTLTIFLKEMGCKNRGKYPPKCHPNCKSKVILHSICTSCESMKQCFKNDQTYRKYFDEEELDTSHWPCERCLEALKSIKMFWRIIIEKLFNINLPKTDKLSLKTNSSNVHSTVKSWQTGILHETLFVKNLLPFLGETKSVKTTCCQYDQRDNDLASSHNRYKDMSDESTCASDSLIQLEKPKVLSRNKLNTKPKKVSRSVSVRVKKTDVCCDTHGLEIGDDEIKTQFNNLQLRFNAQQDDLERLKKENLFLKMEVQKTYNGLSIDPHKCSVKRPAPDAMAVLPKPYDDELTENVDAVESEMIITMKNCKKSDQKQVSFLQVLHKSNQPFYNDTSTSDAPCRKEDPIRVLAKIQTTLGAMVQREMEQVADGRRCSNGNPPPNIDASFHNIKGGKSK